jgi:hypothetical protein
MVINLSLIRIWKEAIVAYFKEINFERLRNPRKASVRISENSDYI